VVVPARAAYPTLLCWAGILALSSCTFITIVELSLPVRGSETAHEQVATLRSTNARACDILRALQAKKTPSVVIRCQANHPDPPRNGSTIPVRFSPYGSTGSDSELTIILRTPKNEWAESEQKWLAFQQAVERDQYRLLLTGTGAFAEWWAYAVALTARILARDGYLQRSYAIYSMSSAIAYLTPIMLCRSAFRPVRTDVATQRILDPVVTRDLAAYSSVQEIEREWSKPFREVDNRCSDLHAWFFSAKRRGRNVSRPERLSSACRRYLLMRGFTAHELQDSRQWLMNVHEDSARLSPATEAEWEYAARAGTTTAYSSA